MSKNKRELILNAMKELLLEEKGATCSVSDIAKKAGIAKGGMYYYFKSKDEVFDAVVTDTYDNIITNCSVLMNHPNLNPLDKLKLLIKNYKSSVVDSSIDEYLHLPQNAAIHQKSLAKIVTSLSPIISDIIKEGIEDGTFKCEYPEEVSEFVMSVFCFLLDPGLFLWKPEEIFKKLKALANILELTLNAPKGSFDFIIYDGIKH